MGENMDCVNVMENLPFFGDGSLDPATEQEMDRHIARCPGCAEAYEAQKRVLNMMASIFNAPEQKQAVGTTTTGSSEA